MSIHQVSTVGRSKVTNNKTGKKETIMVHNKMLGLNTSLAKSISYAARQKCDTIVS